MSEFRDAIRQMMKEEAARVLNQMGRPHWGFVESVDPQGPRVRIRRQPENVLSGWLPVLQQAAGANMTTVTVPLPGWMAFVQPDFGEAEHGVVVGFAHNDGATLPALPNVPGSLGTPNTGTVPLAAGETAFVGAGGSMLRFASNGDIYWKAGSGTIKLDSHLTVNGNVTAQEDIKAVGNIIDLNGAGGGGTLNTLRQAYDAHKHGNVVNGGGTTDLSDHPV